MHLGPSQAGGRADGAGTRFRERTLGVGVPRVFLPLPAAALPEPDSKEGDLGRIPGVRVTGSQQGLEEAHSMHTCAPSCGSPRASPRPTTPASVGQAPPQAAPGATPPFPQARSRRGALQGRGGGGGVPALALGGEMLGRTKQMSGAGGQRPPAGLAEPDPKLRPRHAPCPDPPPGTPALLVWGSARNSGPTAQERAWRLSGLSAEDKGAGTRCVRPLPKAGAAPGRYPRPGSPRGTPGFLRLRPGAART